MTSEIERFDAEHYVSLTTFRRDGTAVPTPVWVAGDGAALYVWTPTRSGKVRRIRRRPEVTLAPCDARGRVRGEAVPAIAEICDAAATDLTRELVKKKYGWTARVLVRLSILRRGRDGTVGLRVTFPS
jgi:hypothetical protein